MPMMASALVTNPILNEEVGKSAMDMKSRDAVNTRGVKNVFIDSLLSKLLGLLYRRAQRKRSFLYLCYLRYLL